MLLDRLLEVAEAEEEDTIARKIDRKAVRRSVRIVVDHIAADIGSVVETWG